MTVHKCLLAGLLSVTGCLANNIITVSFTNLPYTTGEGTYPGWSIATVNNIPTQLLMCDDYYNDTSMPSGPWSFDYSDLAADLSEGVANSPLLYNATNDAANSYTPNSTHTITQDYEAVSYLLFQYWELQPTAPTSPTSAQDLTATNYNFAVWSIFDNNIASSLTSAQTALVANAYSFIANSANASFLNFVYANTVFYSPAAGQNTTNPNQQEFGNITLTPEPGAGWLLAAGLIALAALRQKN
jgi:hypothetical protein